MTLRGYEDELKHKFAFYDIQLGEWGMKKVKIADNKITFILIWRIFNQKPFLLLWKDLLIREAITSWGQIVPNL